MSFIIPLLASAQAAEEPSTTYGLDVANIAVLTIKAEAEYKKSEPANSSRVFGGACELAPSLLLGIIPTFTVDIGLRKYSRKGFQGSYYEFTAGPRIAEHTPYISQVLGIDAYGGIWYGAQGKAIVGYKHIFKNGFTVDANSGLMTGVGVRAYTGSMPHAITPILGFNIDFRVGYSF